MDDFGNLISDASEFGQEAGQQAASAAQQAAASAQQASAEATQAAEQAASAAEEAAQEAASQAEQAANQAEAAAQEAQATAEQAAQDAQEAATEAAAEAQAVAEEAAAQAQEAAAEAQQAAQEAVTEAQAAAEEAVAETEQAAQEAAAQAEVAAQEAQAAAEQAVQEAEAAATEAAVAGQAAAEEAVTNAEETAQEMGTAAEEAAQEAVAEAEQAAQEAAAQAEAAAQEAQAAAEQAVQQAQAAAQTAVAEGEAMAQEAAAQAEAALQQAQQAATEAAAAAEEAAQEALTEAQSLGAAAEEALGSLLPTLPDTASAGSETNVLLSQFFVKIGGKSVPDADMTALMRDVIEIMVDDSLHMPDMFTIHLHDKTLKWVDADLLKIGQEVEISGKAAEGQDEDAPEKNVLIKGEITALEPDFTMEGEPTLLVRGYDRAHRLHRGRQTRSFLQMTDGEIVNKIAQEVGLQTETDPTSPPYEYVFQNNQTNLEFLLERAARIGYQLYVEDKILHFVKGDKTVGEGPELTWGRNLLIFRPRLTAVHQFDEVIVRGWDPKAKKEIVGQATNGKLTPETGLNGSGGELAKEAFQSSAQAVVVSHPVATQDEAQAMAEALSDEISGNFIQAEGVCQGDSRLQVGKTVTILGFGQRFSGKYFVTGATHTYGVEMGYETTFSVSGRQPNTLSDLLIDKSNTGAGLSVVIGLVTNNRDPEGMGRVKVKYPWLADNEESTWARLSSPMAGQGGGFFYLPEINDEVLLAFEHGDIHYPYVLGVLWNGKDKPPGSNDDVVGGDGKVNQRVLKSRSGHVILLDDSDGQEKIEIIDSSEQNKISISTADNTITINGTTQVKVQSGDGAQVITLDNQGQSIELKGGGRSIVLRNGQVQIN